MSKGPAEALGDSMADLSIGDDSSLQPSLSTDEDGVVSLDFTEARRSTNGDVPSELERFRKEWEAEVKARRDGVSIGPVRWKSDREERQEAESSSAAQWRVLPKDMDERHPDQPGSSPPTSKSPVLARTNVIRAQRANDALEIYSRAVEHEQSGQLNDALLLYRRAFKLNGRLKIKAKLMIRLCG
jgi:F-box protein 9